MRDKSAPNIRPIFLYIFLTISAIGLLGSATDPKSPTATTTTTTTTIPKVEPTPTPAVLIDLKNPEKRVLLIPDKEIDYRIRKGLSLAKVELRKNVKVNVSDGVVKYKGVVHSLAERGYAEEIIRSTPGVRRARGYIRVIAQKTDQPFSAKDPRSIGDLIADQEIEKTCIDNLARYGLRRTGNIRVKVYLRMVIVSGLVENDEIRKRIVEHLNFSRGVRQVVDLLQVSPIKK